jgi:hypothetical protein
MLLSFSHFSAIAWIATSPGMVFFVNAKRREIG